MELKSNEADLVRCGPSCGRVASTNGATALGTVSGSPTWTRTFRSRSLYSLRCFGLQNSLSRRIRIGPISLPQNKQATAVPFACWVDYRATSTPESCSKLAKNSHKPGNYPPLTSVIGENTGGLERAPKRPLAGREAD